MSHNPCSAARNCTAASEMVGPWQGDALLEPTLSLDRQNLPDRVHASCMRQHSSSVLCRVGSPLHLEQDSTLSKTWAYLVYLKPCGYGVGIIGLHTTRRTSAARYRWAYSYIYFCPYESQLVRACLLTPFSISKSLHTQKAHITSASNSEMEWALLSMGSEYLWGQKWHFLQGTW